MQNFRWGVGRGRGQMDAQALKIAIFVLSFLDFSKMALLQILNHQNSFIYIITYLIYKDNCKIIPVKIRKF